VVTIRTTRFNIQQFYVLPTVCIYVLYGSQKKTAIISLYIINCLVVITETECVYCAVRAESVNRVQFSLGFSRIHRNSNIKNANFAALKLEARFSETLLSIYQTARCHAQKNSYVTIKSFSSWEEIRWQTLRGVRFSDYVLHAHSTR
jgi:hypothetical protein